MLQKFQEDPRIVYCRALLEKGASVTCVEDGLPTWVAEVRTLHDLHIHRHCTLNINLCWLCLTQACTCQEHFCTRITVQHSSAALSQQPGCAGLHGMQNVLKW